MSLKSDVVALLEAKKVEKVTAVAAEFDALIVSVQGLDDGVVLPPEVEVLQAKVVELEAKVEAAKVAFELDEVEDEAMLLSEKEKVSKLEAKIVAIKAALEL
jgi:hypothetical protein